MAWNVTHTIMLTFSYTTKKGLLIELCNWFMPLFSYFCSSSKLWTWFESNLRQVTRYMRSSPCQYRVIRRNRQLINKNVSNYLCSLNELVCGLATVLIKFLINKLKRINLCSCCSVKRKSCDDNAVLSCTYMSLLILEFSQYLGQWHLNYFLRIIIKNTYIKNHS